MTPPPSVEFRGEDLRLASPDDRDEDHDDEGGMSIVGGSSTATRTTDEESVMISRPLAAVGSRVSGFDAYHFVGGLWMSGIERARERVGYVLVGR